MKDSTETITMNDTQQRFTALEQELSSRGKWLVGIECTVYLVVLLTAVLGNIMLTIAVLKTQTLKRTQNYYLLSLAATDIVIAITSMPLTLVVFIQGTWPFSNFICQLQGSLISVCSTVSLLTLGMIAVNRYVKIVCLPGLYQKIFSKKNVFISIAISWIAITLVTFVAYAFGETVFFYHPGKAICWAKVNLKSALGLYCTITYSLNMSLTYLAIYFSYYKVFRKIRAHFAHVANTSLHSDSSIAFAEEVKVTTMLFVTVVAFIICWIPTNIADLYEIFAGYYTLPRQLYFFNIFTLACSSAVNPLVYGFMKNEFREAYKKVLCGSG